jgi:hypothetical protein
MGEWKQKLGSGFIAAIGALMTMKGMTGDTQWGDLPDMMTPLAVGGLILIFWRAIVGSGQMKVPKKLGKKP